LNDTDGLLILKRGRIGCEREHAVAKHLMDQP
jgi:hypothetical protein